MSAFNVMNAALYSKLAGGTALTAMLSGGTASIYSLEAPFDAAYDYVIYNWQAGAEPNETAHRIKDATIQVRAYSTNQSCAGSIDARCDALLHNQTLTITGWRVVSMVRAQDIQLVEYDESNRPIYTCGGLYEIKIERS